MHFGSGASVTTTSQVRASAVLLKLWRNFKVRDLRGLQWNGVHILFNRIWYSDSE